MSFFISNSIASQELPVQETPYSLIIILVMFGLIFYFMILRPQQKRSKDHKKVLESISKGDEVMTTGGLIGRVAKVGNTGMIILELNDSTEVIIKRDFVLSVLPKGTMKAL